MSRIGQLGCLLLAAQCKECILATRKAYKEAHPERVAEWHRRTMAKHRVRYLAKKRQHKTAMNAATNGLWGKWKSMHNRCRFPGATNAKRYHDRSIGICQEWYDFSVFQEWALTRGWEPGKAIHRVNSGGNYAPGNCVWLSRIDHTRLHNEKVRATRMAGDSGLTICQLETMLLGVLSEHPMRLKEIAEKVKVSWLWTGWIDNMKDIISRRLSAMKRRGMVTCESGSVWECWVSVDGKERSNVRELER